VEAADMDEDGDVDFVVGNLGLNHTYRATAAAPFEVYSYDFDRNGKLDIVMGYYEEDKLYPTRERDYTVKQVPAIGRKFDTFEKYGQATIRDLYGSSLDEALNLKAKTFASTYVENLGNGSFKTIPLPLLAQASSINSILIRDFDQDGMKDLLIAGNLFQTEISTPRNDAGTGLLLKGQGNGNFLPVPVSESGFFAPGDAKDMKMIKVGDREVILVANNNDFLQAIVYAPGSSD
jgi:hypothetical protein